MSQRRVRRMSRIGFAALSAAVLACGAERALARNWNTGNGNWGIGTNWTPAGAPLAGETANIVFSDGVTRVVTLNTSTSSLGLVTVDLTGAGTNTASLFIPTNNSLTANGLIIGGYNGITSTLTNGRAAMSQSAGTTTLNAGWDFTLGYGAGSSGAYTLNGTGVLVANQSEYVGLNGTGVVNQSAGTNTLNATGAFFDIGTYAGSSGTYNLSGTGTLTVKCNEYVGDIGTGLFSQTGGTHSLASGANLFIGNNAAGTGGTYNMGAGTLTTSVGGNGVVNVGYRCNGTFNQIGGNVSLNSFGGLHIGGLAGATGLYTLSGGSLGSNGPEMIGDSGTGTLTQTGGDNGVGAGNDIFVGNNAGSNGIYNLGGTGTLNAGHDLDIGYSGTGTFNQTGGSNTVVEQFNLGISAGSSGTYNLSGGTLQANTLSSYTTWISRGGTGLFNQTGGTSSFQGVAVEIGDTAGASGTFLLSGGVANVTGAVNVGGTVPSGTGVLGVSASGVLNTAVLFVANSPGNVINLSGGAINAGAVNLGGVPALLNWTGGTLNITNNTIWDPAAGASTTSAIFGAAKTLGNNQTLKVTGNESLGGTAAFGLTLNSGSGHVVTGTMTISPTGTITQNAGSTLYAGSIIQAGGNVNGLLQNQTTFTYQSGNFPGRLWNQGAIVFSSSFVAGDGVLNASTINLNVGQTLTVNGAGLDNQSLLNLNAGTLNGAGPIVNNSVISGKGTLAGTGGFTNNGFVTVASGAIALTNSGTNTNSGQVDVPSGQQLQLNGSSLTNTGLIALDAGTISGAATLNNSTGIISGHGTISSPLTNAGSIAVDSGIMNVTTAFTSTGEIALSGGIATLSGSGAIINSGLIRGDGVINKAVTNTATGEIRAESGKRVKLTASNGSNTALINLQGGTAEFSQSLINASLGQIVGRGMLKVGGTGLLNIGQVSLSAGLSDVFGAVANNSGAKITLAGGATATFYNPVVLNSGSEFRVSTNSTAVFFGSVTGTGIFTGNGTKDFEGGGSFLSSLQTPGNTIVGSSASLSAGNIRENSLTVDGSATIPANGTNAATSTANALAVGATGKLDLHDNKLIVRSTTVGTWTGSTYTGLSGYVRSASNNGNWNGNGITTSMTDAVLLKTTLAVVSAGESLGLAPSATKIWGGQTVSGSDALIMYTYAGDLNVDGAVNADDYAYIDLYSQTLGASGYGHGDINYDGAITADDYALIDVNFINQGPPFVTRPTIGGATLSAVPEPAIGAAMILLWPILRRRRI